MTPATILEHAGVKQSITEWALDYGITPTIIIARLERGEPISEAISKPMKIGRRGQRLPIFSPHQCITRHPIYRTRQNARRYSFDGKTLTAHEWADLIGIKQSTFASRIRNGWSIEHAVTSRDTRRRKPGVPSDFQPSKGTGAGSTLQETPNITFSGNDA